MATPWLRRLLTSLAWAAVTLYFTLGLLVLVLRHVVLPGVEGYRDDIERNLGQALGRPVAIRAIDAHWRALWPNLRIHGLEIRDAEGRPALAFEEVEADIAWSSLWHLAPHFGRLEIKAPRLDLRRDATGQLFVAGLPIKADDTAGAGFPEWLLAQDRIVIRDATVTWHDELRKAPPLALSRLNFDLRNRGRRHLFGLTAEPPRELAARLDIRGDFRGDDLESLGTGKGKVYAELDYADLAGWHAWVDYPIELPRGDGGLRLWLDFDRQALTGATADLRLGRTTARLAPDLPMLDLERVAGRLAAHRADDGFVVQTRRLSLATRDGIRIEPTDIDVRWQPAGARPARGEASANLLDVGALAALAAYLPFDAAVREKIAAWGAQGRTRDLQAAWSGEAGALATYRFKARFENLSLNAQGSVPGFFGLDGTVDANERGGEIKLVTRAATLELPAVFEQSSLVLAMLEASADWTVRDGAVEVRLQKASFQNADAVGEASGRYRGDGSGPGEIDLSARLTRADGGAVWRYMPLVVNRNVRDWLQNSIGGGEASATLRLKGDLKRFPFDDGSGIFEVKGPFQGATLRYAEGWPAFENVAGDLLFAGSRMLIRARRATLWGVQLADVKAEIADLDVHEPTLVVTGGAKGATADFLRFIDSSPVGGYIDRVTEGMKAGGGGELRLRLDLPLNEINATRVDGHYRFLGNQLVVNDDLPTIADINGELHFTGTGIEAKKIRAAMLGAPLTIDVLTDDERRVAIQASGSVSAAALRQQYAHPALEHLTGTTPWSGLIRVRKRAAELRVESSLVGISSSLPDPFNKTAGDALPLVFERKALAEPILPRTRRAATGAPAGERDQVEVSLGDTLRARLLMRREEGGDVVEQGLIAIGAPEAGLPERGIRLAVKAPQVDLDFWRRLAGGRGGALPLTQFDLRTDELRVFRRSIHALQLAGRQEGATWKMDLKSDEAAGRLEWTRGERDDRLTARLARLDIPESRGGAPDEPTGETGNGSERLPDIDLAVDRFQMHGRDMGQLQLKAQNEAGVWNAQFQIRSEDGDLAGGGRWQEAQGTAPAATALDFKLTTSNVENMLDRLGYPNAVRRGRATLAGQLSWNGAPTRIDYPSLGGKLNLEAARGQFKKLEPGVGRLLGVLSLQSLPRRISLDFRDIFSEGFAFESIEGKVSVAGGVMETSEFEINGPAAKVMMNGSVNLVQETQDLKVRVQPAIGETVATGALLVNPVVGATAWLMNRMFGNPLDKAFAFDYSVTGSWADPKVEKVAAQGPRAALNFEEAVTQ